MLRPIRLAALVAVLATPVAAADLALVIGNEDYRALADNRRGTEVVDAAEALEEVGVEVIAVRDGDREETFEALDRFVQSAPRAERLLVVLSARFASTVADAYLLPVDAEVPSVARLPREALPLSVVLAALAEAPGRAVLVLAGEEDRDAAPGPYVRAGYGAPEVPQGVTLVTAGPRAARDLVRDVLAKPGQSVSAGAVRITGVEVTGFQPREDAFLTAEETDEPDRAWEDAERRDTIAAYEAYLDAWPDGRRALEARLRLAELRRDPARQAKEAEDALALSREERQQIQRDLSILGYDTRGIDGIFGPGTRGAIEEWQRSEGRAPTGYLDPDEVDRLARQAVARAEELEREAEARRAERTRRDRAFWEETGARETESGYRRYLAEYPDGIYAEIAQGRLDEIEAARRAEADAADRAAWQEAQQQGTPGAYRRYLERFPQGAFGEEARAALDDDGAKPDREQQRAAEIERALGLTPVTARIVEERLDALGLQPGAVDGQLDDNSRRAIRRYQNDRNLPVTGYLNQPTVVQLLADSVRQLLD